MAKLTVQTIEPKAIRAWSNLAPCSFHQDVECHVTHYETAELFRSGDKSHRMSQTVHSADGVLLGQSAPFCGSKKYGYGYSGQFVREVTCKRCW